MSTPAELLQEAEEGIDEILDSLSSNSDIGDDALRDFYDDVIHRMTVFRKVL